VGRNQYEENAVMIEAPNGFAARALPWLLAAYGLASLAHFAHNAEYLGFYPNLPAWFTRAQIYGAWCAITAVGIAGYWLRRGRHAWVGVSLLALYAILGFDGLLHYRLAPMAAHTVAMNATILIEVAAAAVVLIAVIGAARSKRHSLHLMR
jgi:hypothetical protein